MSKTRDNPRPCAICGRSFAPRDLVSGVLAHDRVSEESRAEHPQWSREKFICRPDLSRFRAQHDYEVNLKAELEIRHLHEKIDHLLTHQWERLFEIQEIQIELLQEMGRNA